MLYPRLTNCPECANIPSLLKKIDCKLAELGNSLYNNISYMLNQPIAAGDIIQLIAYKRILMYKYVNPNYAQYYSISRIASKVMLLTIGCDIKSEYIPTVRETTTTTTTPCPTTTTTTTSLLTLKLLFNSIETLNSLVLDPYDVSNWNDLFDTVGGTPYSSVEIIYTEVSSVEIIYAEVILHGGANVKIPNHSIGVSGLMSIIDDSESIIEIYDAAFSIGNSLLTVVVLNGVTVGGDNLFNTEGIYPISRFEMNNLEIVGSNFINGFRGTLTTLNLPKLTTSSGFLVNSSSVTSISAPLLQTIGNSGLIYTGNVTSYYFPSLINLGSSVLYNSVFEGVNYRTLTLTIPSALMTNNAGGPDGDIVALTTYNTVTIITT